MSGPRGVRREVAGPAHPDPANLDPTHLDAWLRELDLEPSGGAEREGIVSRDLVLHGRRRGDLRATVILEPAIGCLILWLPYAPPLRDGFRRTYQRLLRWNDELPFAKFGLADEDRITLSVELPLAGLDREALGLGLARLVAVCDLLVDESAAWVWPDGRPAAASLGRPSAILDRYAAALGELAAAGDGAAAAPS